MTFVAIEKIMCLNNQDSSETQPLLEEHVETGQERRPTSKYRYFIIAAVLFSIFLGAGLIIYYAEGKLDNGMYLIKKKNAFKIITK